MKLRVVHSWIIAMALAAAPGIASAEIFMLITGVAGDSTAKGHEKWIRVSSLDWEVEAATSYLQGGGASVGKPFPDAIKLALPTGTWSQQFVKLIIRGQSMPSVVIDAMATDGRPLYRVTAVDPFVTQYNLVSAPDAPLPQDRVRFVFKTVKIEYYTLGADGRLVTTLVEWEIPTMKTTAQP